MLKFDYKFTAKTPIFTGSNENKGTVRTLRREKVLLQKKESVKSTFKSKDECTKALMDIIYNVYTEIDLNLKSSNYGFYAAYANKVLNATFVKTKEEFITKLTESLGIENMSFESSNLILNALRKFNDFELLQTIRNEHAYLMILLREYVSFYKDKNKVAKAGISQPTLFDALFEKPAENPEIENVIIEKHFETVPYFNGNSIRGYLRRLLMADFEQIVGIEKLDKSIYHQLHTGGNISDSTGFEDIEKREQFIANCPAISLLGSAIGNMTIHGDLSVVGARLQCKENGTGERSYWNFLQNIFHTRHDTSKSEKTITIVAEDKKRAADQMIFETETFVKGSKFDAMFILRTAKARKDYDLIVSTFYRMLKLWQKEPFIGGNSARDMGVIELNFDIPENADKLYVDYLNTNKEKIKKYFELQK